MERRNFIRISGASLGSLLISSYIKAEGKKNHSIKLPDAITIQADNEWFNLESSNQNIWKYKDVVVELKLINDLVSVHVQSPTISLKTVKLSWKYPFSKTAQLLSDHWERTYGDVQWKPVDGTAKMPWYVIQHDESTTNCFGVKTGGNTICYWQANADELSLSLDTKSGGDGVRLGNRKLHAADIITTQNALLLHHPTLAHADH